MPAEKISAPIEGKSMMSDKHESSADQLPLPVQAVTTDTTETVADEDGTDEKNAGIVGIGTGASASFATAITTEMP
jgi:hypothetical protein